MANRKHGLNIIEVIEKCQTLKDLDDAYQSYHANEKRLFILLYGLSVLSDSSSDAVDWDGDDCYEAAIAGGLA